MIRLLFPIALLTAAAAAAACDTKEPNASEDVFQSGASDMNERLETYAEDADTTESEPAEAPAPATENQPESDNPDDNPTDG